MRKGNKNILNSIIDSISLYGGVENTRYFYHGDHLGSSSWITDKDGNALQYISYLPYGQLFMDLKTTSYDASYKFIGKERDTETGFDYFGARYYSNALGVWLSVDPLADARAWSSPYSYCQNNPLGRVDDSGMLDSVFITGPDACQATEQLQQNTPNLQIIRAENNGKLSYAGKPKTRAEKKIANAINSKNVNVNITAENSDLYTFNGEELGFRIDKNIKSGGSFLGNEVIKNEDGSFSVNTFQRVNPNALADLDGKTNGKGLMGHEFLESYFGGLISLKNMISSSIAGRDGSVYEKAHRRANKYFLGDIKPIYEYGPANIGGNTINAISVPVQTGWTKTR